MKHTPKPWAWDDKVPSDYNKADWSEVAPWLCGENGEPVLMGQIVCKNPVDVCLIAAAPELLEALQAAIECGMVPSMSARSGGACAHVEQLKVADQIRDAIAKATGADNGN